MNEKNQNKSSNKLRILTVSLVFSGALNIGLIATGLFTSTCETELHSSPKIPSESSLDASFSVLKNSSYSELVSMLTNKDPVKNGYLKRDLGLAALVAFHDFNIDKALSGGNTQPREVVLNNGTSVNFFPSLNTPQFEAIIRFAYEEKWPLTSKGLFNALKKSEPTFDKSLVEAFKITDEFRTLEMLFQSSKLPTLPLLELVLEGSFGDLREHCPKGIEISKENRRDVLSHYIKRGSTSAASIFLKTDHQYALTQLDEKRVLELLSCFSDKTEGAETYCIELLHCPKSEAIWTKATENLYRFSGKKIPQPFDLKEAMGEFIPLARSKGSAPPVRNGHEHMVQEGETLWKIARKYNVTVDLLLQHNQIEKDHLRVGMKVVIPNR